NQGTRPSRTAKSSKIRKTSTLTPKFRAEQYPKDYESGDKLFCKLCQHTIDWTRKNTCDDHLKSKAHVKNKEKHRVSQSIPLQTTISSASSSADSRREFIQDFAAVYGRFNGHRPCLLLPEGIQGGSERRDAQQCSCTLSLSGHQSGG
uniref:U1-type domain-containing protein n=1 Tax=Oncorhynchus mykiss TaxID=8022 RepID=A0A8C7NTZ0_ONCMY